MKRFLMVAGLVAMTLTSQVKAAFIPADIVFVVDESGSMGTVQANIRNNIGTFATELANAGIDATFALVGYGNGNIRPRVLTDFTTAAAFSTAAQGLVASGGTEPAYEAIMKSLSGGLTPGNQSLSYRNGAVKNIIIVTDEPSNGDLAGFNWGTADALLGANNALLNGILTLGQFGSADTVANGGTLRSLVEGNGGSVFNLSTFNTNDQNVIDAFVADFAARKIEEIIENAVPEPASLALFGLGIAGVAAARRRQRKVAA